MPLRPVARTRPASVRAGSPGPIYALAEAAFVRDDIESCSLLLPCCETQTAADRARVSLLKAKVARIEGDRETWFASAREASRDDVPVDIRLSGRALAALASRDVPGIAQHAIR